MADPAEFKVVMGFAYDGKGWQEDYITSAISDKNVLATAVNQLILKRTAVLPDVCSVQGVRVSNCHIYASPGTVRETQLFYPSGVKMDGTSTIINIERNGGLATPTPSDKPEQANVCLQMRLTFGAGRQTMRYLAGIPKYVTASDPGAMTNFAATPFGEALDAFTAFLKGPFWQVQSTLVAGTSPQYSIAGIRTDGATPPNLMFDVYLKSQSPPKAGDQLHMQLFRAQKNTRLPTINGRWICKAWNAGSGQGDGSITVYGSEGILPSQIRFNAHSFIRLPKIGFAGIDGFAPQRVTTHKRGRVPFVSRGRRLTHFTLDP